MQFLIKIVIEKNNSRYSTYYSDYYLYNKYNVVSIMYLHLRSYSNSTCSKCINQPIFREQLRLLVELIPVITMVSLFANVKSTNT